MRLLGPKIPHGPRLTAHPPSRMSDYARAVSSSIEPASPQLLEHVPAWLTVPEIAERLGVTLARVRQMIEDREVLAARVGDNRAIAVPEALFDDDGPLPALKGT